jgi:hypothetical protein
MLDSCWFGNYTNALPYMAPQIHNPSDVPTSSAPSGTIFSCQDLELAVNEKTSFAFVVHSGPGSFPPELNTSGAACPFAVNRSAEDLSLTIG